MTAKKGGLGKGLGALLSDSNTEVFSSKKDENRIIFIDINKITPNREQPRKDFNRDALEELSESIKIHGIIQPIIVKTVKNGYEIIAGERRWRAARLAELKEVPCIIREYSEEGNMLIALIENLQRENLNPMEESLAYSHLSANFNMNQTEISKNVGKSRSYVANSIRLQNLPDEVQQFIADGQISAGHGRALLGLNNPGKQYDFAQSIIEKGLSVRETEDLLREMLAPKVKTETTSARRDPALKEIEGQIRDSIGAKVRIKEKNNKGTIQLSFYNRDELERLIEVLTNLR